MPDYPDSIAFIARLREEGIPEKEIAARIGVTPKTLWGRVSQWNKKNPDNPLPRPANRPATPFYVQAAQLRQQGMSCKAIAAKMGRPLTTIHVWLTHARKVGALSPRTSLREEGGADTWTHYARKGAVPHIGNTSTVIGLLTTEQVEYLIGRIDRKDATFAHTLARILKEHIDEKVPSGG